MFLMWASDNGHTESICKMFTDKVFHLFSYNSAIAIQYSLLVTLTWSAGLLKNIFLTDVWYSQTLAKRVNTMLIKPITR